MEPECLLVIDADPNLCRILQRILKRQGWWVVHATDGRHGLALATELHPHLVVLDLDLPGRFNGAAVAQALRTRYGPTLPLVLTSGDAEAWTRAWDLGANVFFRKPFDLEQLVATVEELLTH